MPAIDKEASKKPAKVKGMSFHKPPSWVTSRVPVSWSIMPAPMNIQLLLENAIKHNVVSDIEPLHINIFIEEGHLVVSNNLQKKEVLRSGEGVGLNNIVSRYALLTDKEVKVEQNKSDFKVKIPILTKELNLIKNKKYNEMDAYLTAKKQVNDIKDFYGNLLSFLVVMPILVFINYKTHWDFKWFIFPLVGWGLGLALQAFTTFGYGKTWEERKIQELMEKEEMNNKHKWQ